MRSCSLNNVPQSKKNANQLTSVTWPASLHSDLTQHCLICSSRTPARDCGASARTSVTGAGRRMCPGPTGQGAATDQNGWSVDVEDLIVVFVFAKFR